MGTVRSLGGWLVAAVCLPTAVALLYQRSNGPAAASESTDHRSPTIALARDPVAANRSEKAPATSQRDEQSPAQFFDSIDRDPLGQIHLKGVKSVSLLAFVSDDRKAITESDVTTRVEFKLRQAGIGIAKPEGANDRKSDGNLVIQVTVADIPELRNVSIVSVRTDLLRDVVSRPEQKLVKSPASVWWDSRAGVAGELRLGETCYSSLDREIESLANAIATANGK